MMLSIHSSATFQGEGAWPSIWPPAQLPPPSPLSAAAAALWSPKATIPESAPVVDPNGPLYSTQLAQGGQSGSTDSQGGAQLAYLDQRIAIMSFDATQPSADDAAA